MKILILSQHLFPIQTPRSNRTTELVKELGRKGHDVTVYAVLGKYDYSAFENEFQVKVKNIPLSFQVHAYNSDGDGKRTLIDKIFGRLFRKALEFPNIEFMFKVPKIIKSEKNIDLLISIADPHQIHWGCAKARKKDPKSFPKVWIADCGDPFMTNGNNNSHLFYFSKYEKLFSTYCDYITVPVEEAKDGYYPEFRSKIKVIPQGFEYNKDEDHSPPENATITFAYAGTFYKGIRDPAKFLHYLASLPIDYKFIVYTLYKEMILPYESVLGERLEIRKPLDRKILIEELKKMDFLLNIENINCPTQIPSKLIDYALTGRPILSINPIELDTIIIDNFFSKDYSNQFVIENIDQYNITNVTEKFLELAKLVKEV